MKCFRLISFCLVSLLAFFFVSSFHVNNVFASSVSCGSYNLSYQVDFSDCDTSSLDSSSDWFYTISFSDISSSSSSSTSRSILAYRNGCNTYNFNFFNFSIQLRYYSNLSHSSLYFSDSLRTLSTFSSHVSCLHFGLSSSDLVSGSFSIGISDFPFGSGFNPSGSLSISENGSYDVSSYAQAVVEVPPEVIQGDYHDDLLAINKSILICAAVCLVIYFFYCIYRMIIKSSGGFNV